MTLLKVFSFFIAIHSDTSLLAQLVDFLAIKIFTVLWLLCPVPDNYIFLSLNAFLLLLKFKCSSAIFLKGVHAFQYVVSSHFEKELIYNYLVQYNKIVLYNKTLENLYGVTTNGFNEPDPFHLYCIDLLKITHTDAESTNNSQFFQKLKSSIENPSETNSFSKNLRGATIIVLSLFTVRHLANIFLGNF